MCISLLVPRTFKIWVLRSLEIASTSLRALWMGYFVPLIFLR